jgi:hypothetical protein
VLVVVIAIGCVPVPVMDVVDMVAVRDRLVPAIGAMRVTMSCMGEVRERMLIVVAVMGGVRMSLVDVVDMPLTLGTRVPAAGSVYVVMQVNLMLVGGHGSSLL